MRRELRYSSAFWSPTLLCVLQRTVSQPNTMRERVRGLSMVYGWWTALLLLQWHVWSHGAASVERGASTDTGAAIPSNLL